MSGRIFCLISSFLLPGSHKPWNVMTLSQHMDGAAVYIVVNDSTSIAKTLNIMRKYFVCRNMQ